MDLTTYLELTGKLSHLCTAFDGAEDGEERERIRADYEEIVDQLPKDEQRHYRGRIAGDVFDSYEVGRRLAEEAAKEKVAAGS